MNAINMLHQAAKAIDKKALRFGYDGALEQLAEHLGDVRDGKHTWEEFAQAYCLTEQDRKPASNHADEVSDE